MCVISAYAPPLYAEQDLKDVFYEELNQVIADIPVAYRHHIVVLGDFNARIGQHYPIWSDIRGQYGLNNELNANGQMLLDLCTRHRLLIANTLFQKPFYGTWHHPRSKKWVTLDYILISKSSRHLCNNCGIQRLLLSQTL